MKSADIKIPADVNLLKSFEFQNAFLKELWDVEVLRAMVFALLAAYARTRPSG